MARTSRRDNRMFSGTSTRRRSRAATLQSGLRGRLAGALRRIELGLDDAAVAIGADAVAELHVGMVADVLLDLLPVILVVTDLLAVRANRKQPAQLAHARQRLLEL